TLIVEEDRVRLPEGDIHLLELDSVVHVRINRDKVFPTIVIHIVDSIAPSTQEKAPAREQTCMSKIVKNPTALIVKIRKSLIRDRGHEKVGSTVVVHIPKVGAHVGQGRAVAIEGHACLKRHFVKR